MNIIALVLNEFYINNIIKMKTPITSESIKQEECSQPLNSSQLKGKTVLKSSTPDFSASPEMTLSSISRETLNCSICPSDKCIHKNQSTSINNTFANTSSSVALPLDQRGGIVQFEKPSLYNENGNLDSSRYMEYINESASKIQKRWKQYNYSKKVKINMYRGGIVPLFKRCKSVDNLHITDEQNLNYIYDNSLMKKIRPRKIQRIAPQVLTKDIKSTYANFMQKNISSQFKYKSNRKIVKSKKVNVKNQVADMWIEESDAVSNENFTIEKQQNIFEAQNQIELTIKAPMCYSEGTSTVTWEETNQHISKNIDFTIDKMKTILEFYHNYSLSLSNDIYYWNRKNDINKEDSFTIDKLDKTKFFRVVPLEDDNVEIQREYERRIWNNMTSVDIAERFESINKRTSIFYSINATDNKYYEINVGLTPQDIMYTLTKRDIMFIWNKSNHVQNIDDLPIYNCNHNNILTFRSEEEEKEDESENKNILQDEPLLQEEIRMDTQSDKERQLQKDTSNSMSSNNCLFELQVCSIEVYGKIKNSQNLITNPDTFSFNIEEQDEKVDSNSNEPIEYVKERWNKENEISNGANALSFMTPKNYRSSLKSEPNIINFNNSFNSNGSSSWTKKIYPAQESNIKYIVNTRSNKAIPIISKTEELTMEAIEGKKEKIIVLENKIANNQSFTLLQTIPPKDNNLIDEQTQTAIEENVNNTSSESPKNIEASSAPFEVNVIQNDDYIQQIKLNLMKSINKKSTAMKSTSKTKLKSGNKNIQSKYKSSNKPSININNSINYVQYSITPNSKELNKVKTGGINANQI